MLQWGVLGGAISTNLTYIANMVVQDLLIALSADSPEFKDMWVQWSRSTLSGLGSFLETAISSAVIECFQWWALELLIFIAGYSTSQREFDA